MKLLIKNGMVISMADNKEMYSIEDICINDDEIVYVGNSYSGEYDKVIDATGKIVMPGLINCHTHLGMSIFRATNDNYPLDKWLKEYIWPVEDNMTDEDMYYTTLLSLVEMVKTGTTCFNDMYYNWRGSIKAFDKIGIRGVYSRCLIGSGIEFSDKVSDFKELVSSYRNNLISFSVTPHSLYTLGEDELKECEELATLYKMPIHIHLSENREEVNTIKDKYKMLPVNVLDKYNYLNHKLILGHGTFISEEEVDILKGKDVSICTNPLSNLNLGCGIADLKMYRDKGINLCLGTDGVGSGNNLNLFYHMSLVDNLQKGKYEDPTVMSSYEVLKMATINGAYALGLDKIVGSIEVGKKADIIILSMDDIEMYPCINPIVQVVHNSWYNSVDTTIINGNIIVDNKKINIDIDNLKEKIKDIEKRLMS